MAMDLYTGTPGGATLSAMRDVSSIVLRPPKSRETDLGIVRERRGRD
jgi:hypothetical protein